MKIFTEQQINGEVYLVMNALPKEDFMLELDPITDFDDNPQSLVLPGEKPLDGNDLKKIRIAIENGSRIITKPKALKEKPELFDEYAHEPYTNTSVKILGYPETTIYEDKHPDDLGLKPGGGLRPKHTL